MITGSLKWSMHVARMYAATFRKHCFLKRKLKKAPSNVNFHAYKALVRPKPQYASIVRDPVSQTDILAIEKTQRFYLYTSSNRMTLPLLLCSNNIQTLEVWRKLAWLNFLHMLLNRKFYIYYEIFLQPITSRVTRHYHQLSIAPISARTNLFKLGYFSKTINDWNALSRELFQGWNFPSEIEEYFGLRWFCIAPCTIRFIYGLSEHFLSERNAGVFWIGMIEHYSQHFVLPWLV